MSSLVKLCRPATVFFFFFLTTQPSKIWFGPLNLHWPQLKSQGQGLCSPTDQWSLPAVLWAAFPQSTSIVLILMLSREQVLLFPHQGCEDSSIGRSRDMPAMPRRWSVDWWAGSLMPLQDLIVACMPTVGKNKDADRTGRPCGCPLACSDSCEYRAMWLQTKWTWIVPRIKWMG